MVSSENFFVSGPTHMMVNTGYVSSPKMDWDNMDHRRCMTACLVKGTYVMESDQTNGTKFAPAWWESFHFRRINVFQCYCKCVLCELFGANARFVCGAVFEYVPPASGWRHPSAPRYVVAFRGTMPRDPTIFGDMRLNLNIVLNKQDMCNRFNEARDFVERLVDSVAVAGNGDGSAVWLTGHSLGASIALDVGRYMMNDRGYNLPTFLFNPPHVSLGPVANLLGELGVTVSNKAKQDVHLGRSLMKHVMGKTILAPQKRRMEAVFDRLSPWVPELYVNQRDFICNGYIDHFELREQALERHPEIARSAATLAHRDLLRPCAVSGFGDKKGGHLLPSARLWKNSSPYGNAHELRQWWQRELSLTCKQYSWS